MLKQEPGFNGACLKIDVCGLHRQKLSLRQRRRIIDSRYLVTEISPLWQ